MGIQDLEVVNRSLLAKWAWKATYQKDNLWKEALSIFGIPSRFWWYQFGQKIWPKMTAVFAQITNFTRFTYGPGSDVGSGTKTGERVY
jgi:hypothetical protein